jgi:hemerythrin-like domain-containing protein
MFTFPGPSQRRSKDREIASAAKAPGRVSGSPTSPTVVERLGNLRPLAKCLMANQLFLRKAGRPFAFSREVWKTDPLLMKITEALQVEHGLFGTLFDFIDRQLEGPTTLAEVQLMARLMERMLRKHSDCEEGLMLAALDHLLEEKGQRDRFYQDHQEIDGRLQRLLAVNRLDEAVRLLKEVMGAARQHFRCEERTLFPLIERELQTETLVDLGKALIP